MPAERTDDVAAIADSVVALHSTDPSTVYLSAMVRMQHPSIEAVSKALYDDRTVVRHHAMRRTLWVFTPQIARWAHAACTVALAPAQWKRLAKMAEDSGIATDGAAWAEVARDQTLAALTSMGTATARQLGKAVPALTQKLHLGLVARKRGDVWRALTGVVEPRLRRRHRRAGGRPARGTTPSTRGRWPSSGCRAGWPARMSRRVPRSFRATTCARFGPASIADLQWWAGWTTGTTKRALAAIDAIEVGLEDADGRDAGWVLPDDADDAAPKPWLAFLPALDPTTMGWKNRAWYLGDLARFGGPVFDVNGNAGPTIWVDGSVVGGWAQRKSGEIVHRLLADVPARRLKAIAAEAERVRGLIGEARVNVRFPSADPEGATGLSDPTGVMSYVIHVVRVAARRTRPGAVVVVGSRPSHD